MLGANSFFQSLQLPLHRSVVNRAPEADHRASQKRRVPPVSRSDFLAGQLPDLRFELTLLGVAERAGAGDLGLGDSQPRVEFFFELRGDWLQKMYSPVIDQDRDQIPHLH